MNTRSGIKQKAQPTSMLPVLSAPIPSSKLVTTDFGGGDAYRFTYSLDYIMQYSDQSEHKGIDRESSSPKNKANTLAPLPLSAQDIGILVDMFMSGINDIDLEGVQFSGTFLYSFETGVLKRPEHQRMRLREMLHYMLLGKDCNQEKETFVLVFDNQKDDEYGDNLYITTKKICRGVQLWLRDESCDAGEPKFEEVDSSSDMDCDYGEVIQTDQKGGMNWLRLTKEGLDYDYCQMLNCSPLVQFCFYGECVYG